MNRFIPLGALCLAAVGGYALWQAATPTPHASTTALPYGAAIAQETAKDADAADIDTSSIVEMTMGPEDAAVTVTEYASFTCPHCATFHKGPLKKLKADYVQTGKVRFIYRDVYFDRYGLWASMVARCGGQDRFFGIAEMIYDQQRDWIGDQDPTGIIERLRKIAKVAGLSDEALDACLADEDKARTLVAWYKEHSEADDITSTPTLIIDGEKHSNMSYDELRTIIDAKLGE